MQRLLRAMASDLCGPAQAATPRRALAGLRLMTIDDQAEAREALTAVLEAHGAQVQAMDSGLAALQQLAQQPRELWPQLLICDIALGAEDGYEVLRRLRALEAQRDTRQQDRIPAIALTGCARAEDRMRSLLAGFHLHVAKPVEPQELVNMVKALALCVA